MICYLMKPWKEGDSPNSVGSEAHIFRRPARSTAEPARWTAAISRVLAMFSMGLLFKTMKSARLPHSSVPRSGSSRIWGHLGGSANRLQNRHAGPNHRLEFAMFSEADELGQQPGVGGESNPYPSIEVIS